MGILDTNKSSSQYFNDDRDTQVSESGSYVGDGATVYNTDSETTRRALELAGSVVKEGLAVQRYAMELGSTAQREAGGFTSNALAAAIATAKSGTDAVLAAKTDAGQSERILKIVAVTSAAALLGYLLLKK